MTKYNKKNLENTKIRIHSLTKKYEGLFISVKSNRTNGPKVKEFT